MCGIAGYACSRNHFSPVRVAKALDQLAHRGPDEQGVYESANVALGCVRLRVIDPAAGAQPMSTEDSGLVLVFNGEIYNHAELRAELSSLGHRFRTACDTEVILRAFREWDTDCFARFRGMFALALWSEPTRRLVLARDRLGIKPLYVWQERSDVCFASELKGILVHPEVERRLDLDALHCYLSLNYVPGPATLLRGIRKLEPGHWLEWRAGAVRTSRYWTLPRFTERPITENEAAEQLDSLLRDSVREHLAADVPVGIWISGGLDSSAILHYAAAASPSRLSTFSVSFSGQDCDEGRYSREVAAHYGTRHYELDLNPQLDLSGAIEQIAAHHDEPGADAGALPIWFLSQMTRETATVVLSGEGADELFGGYLTYAADRLAARLNCVPMSLRRAAQRALGVWPVADKKLGFEYKAKRFAEGWQLPASLAHVFWNGALSEEQQRHILRDPDSGPMRALLAGFDADCPPETGMGRYLWFDQRYYLPDNILAKVDRISMAHSIEVRPPFLDHRILEFAATLPHDLKIRGRTQKYLLRRLMADRLPARTLRRKKEGFDIPAHEWLRGPLRPFLLDVLSSDAVERTGLFRWSGVRELITAHMERRLNVGYQLWGLLVLFLWMQRWNVTAQPPQRAVTPESARATTAKSW